MRNYSITIRVSEHDAMDDSYSYNEQWYSNIIANNYKEAIQIIQDKQNLISDNFVVVSIYSEEIKNDNEQIVTWIFDKNIFPENKYETKYVELLAKVYTTNENDYAYEILKYDFEYEKFLTDKNVLCWASL